MSAVVSFAVRLVSFAVRLVSFAVRLVSFAVRLVSFAVRQSGWLIFFLLLFALLNGAYVGEGLWQGSGLHGFTLQPGAKGGPPRIVSTRTAFAQMLLFLGLAGLMLGLKVWHTLKISRILLKAAGAKDM